MESKRLATYAFFIIPLMLIASISASAMSCDKDALNFRVDGGNWAYGEIKCSDANDVEADYIGNLSDKTRILVEQDGNIFKVGMLTDARSAEQGTYRGKLIITDESGRERRIDTRLRVGDGTEEQISLSKESVSFEIDNANRTECYTVDINNSGNVELNNIKAEFTTADLTFFHNNNVSHPNWIEMSEINDSDYKVGDVKHLEICVNTYTDHLNLKNRETTIAITADGLRAGSIKEEIKVSLLVDYDSEWQKKYDTLNEQHQFLEKAYSRERAYRYAYEELNKTYAGLLQNYTTLETILNSTNQTRNEINNSRANDTKNNTKPGQKNNANETAKNQTTTTTTTAPATSQENNAQPDDASADEKFLEELKKNKEAQNKTTENGNTTSSGGLGIIGSFVKIDPSMTPYAAGGLLLAVVLLALAFTSTGIPLIRKTRKAPEKKTAINTQDPHDTSEPTPLKLEGSRDDQKEELKRILLNRLLEEKALRKSI